MTSRRKEPPELPPQRTFDSKQGLSEEDLAELWEPDETPDEPLNWMYVVVVDQARPRQPGQPPSLAELLESLRSRTLDPEPDLEAEP